MRTPIIYTLLFAYFLLFSNRSYAQLNGEIRGILINQTRPIAAASVKLKMQDSSVVQITRTSNDGTFLFKKLSNGRYFVEISSIGFTTKKSALLTLSSENLVIDLSKIELEENAVQLKEVQVESRQPYLDIQQNKTILNINDDATSIGKTAYEIIANAPGISLDRNGNMSLKGKRGVHVLLDGKQTYLSSSQLANYLQSITGSTIQKIEIITNPSAKYDASGSAGIINIVLKKNKAIGTNGTINIGTGYGKYLSSQLGFTLNHRAKKFNIYGSVNGNTNKSVDSLIVTRSNTNSTSKTFFKQQNVTTTSTKGLIYTLGFDWFINENSTLNLDFSGNVTKQEQLTASNTSFGRSFAITDSSLIGSYPFHNSYTKHSADINYKRILDSLGKSFSVDVDRVNYNNMQNADYNNVLYTSQSLPIRSIVYKTVFPSNVNIISSSINYVHPFSKKTKLEIGAKSSWVKTDNNFQFEDYLDSKYTFNADQSDHFIFKENINAAYMDFNKEFKSGALEIGIRVENTNSSGGSFETSDAIRKNYTNLFPNLLYNTNLTPNSQLGVSFSRRIDRPGYSSLNPFKYYIDLYTSVQGNPNLSPQYTNSIEIYYNYKKKLNITLGYSSTNHVIAGVIITDTLKKTILQTSQNLALLDNYNLNVNYPFKCFSWWSWNVNSTIYYNHYYSPVLLNNPFVANKFSVNASARQVFAIGNNDKFELYFNYHSNEISGPIAYKYYYNVDVGYSRSFLSKKASVRFAVSDIFNTSKRISYSLIPSEDYNIYMKGQTRVFKLSLDYRFGSNENKTRQKKTRSSSTEENRVR